MGGKLTLAEPLLDSPVPLQSDAGQVTRRSGNSDDEANNKDTPVPRRDGAFQKLVDVTRIGQSKQKDGYGCDGEDARNEHIALLAAQANVCNGWKADIRLNTTKLPR